jgi:5-formyltetrahydrofolate cyclo-ligase
MSGVPELERHGQPSADAPKSVWRSWARRKRRETDSAAAGRLVAESLSAWPAYRGARRVLLYLAFGGEPDLRPLLTDHTKSFYTTRVVEGRYPGEGEPRLTLHRLDPEALERHRFGFLQPVSTAVPMSPTDIDLVLVPGLAFDASGNRLGFGMGFYDRLLVELEADVPRVGVTPAALLVPRLPEEDHDVRMTHLATEDGVLPLAP